jgi:Tfp pilus assembly PilM family ATPase
MMARRTLGIEVGSSSIRGVCVSKSWRQTGLDDHFTIDFPAAYEAAEAAPLLGDRLDELSFPCDHAVLSFNDCQALLHPLSFPFTDLDKIREVAGFELESQLPISLADYAWDILPLGPGQAGEQSVLAVLYPLDRVHSWVEQLQSLGLKVFKVEIRAAALAEWLKNIPNPGHNSSLVFYADQETTHLIWIQKQRLLSLRCLSFGIRHIHDELAEKGLLESEKDLQSKSLDLSGSSAGIWEQAPSFGQLLRETSMTLMAAQGQEAPHNIIFSSPVSKTSGLGDALAAALELEIQELPKAKVPFSLLHESPSSHLPAIVSAVAGHRDGRDFNLLQSIPGFHEQNGALRPHLRFVFLSLAAILLSWGLAFGLDIYQHKSRLQELNKQLSTAFEEIVPDAAASVNPLQYTSVVKDRIQKLQNRGRGDNQAFVSASQTLEAVSSSLSREAEVRITLFALDGTGLRMEGLAPDFKTVDAVKNALENANLVREVNITGANAAQDGGGITFGLSLNLREKL